MIDSAVISACIASREAYDRVKAYVNVDEWGPQSKVWWPLIVAWYEADSNARGVDVAILRERGKRSIDSKHHETLLGWLDDLPPAVSPANAANELLQLQKQQRGLELQHAISANTPADKLASLAEDFAKTVRQTELSRSATRVSTWDSMLDLGDPSNKLKLAPSALNERCGGGAVPGDFILVFARPEIGKTLWTVNMACGFAKMGHTVLYVGNEEDVGKAHMRATCNLLNCTEEVIRKQDVSAVKAAAHERGVDRITFVQLTPGSVAEIEELIQEISPEVLIVDQIRNVGGSGGDKLTEKLDRIGGQFRALLAKHRLVGVFVTQAGDGTQVWLDMSNIDNSKTGLPGHADLIIGVGADDDMKRRGKRAVSLPKNKLGNDHRGFTVTVDEERSRVQ